MQRLLRMVVIAGVALATGPTSASELAQAIFGDLTEQSAELTQAALTVTPRIVPEGIAASTNKEGRCQVNAHPDFIAHAYAEEIALVFGHELAHCLLRHHQSVEPSDFPNRVQAWVDEYEADSLGLMLARAAGYSFTKAPLKFLLRDSGDEAHPPGPARLRAIRGGTREFPAAPPTTIAAR